MNAQPIKVLLIEDNPGDAELVQEYLADGGAASFVLECAGRLSAGLDCLDRGGIDVLLLDLSLPDSQGLETLDRVIAHAPTVPVLILTGLEEDALGLEAIRRGAQDYLVKGQITGSLIARTIRYGIERSRVREQLQQQEEHLRLLCGQMPAVLWTTNRELCFTSSLGAALHRLHLEPGQIVGTPLVEYFQTSDPEFPPLAAHRRALLGETTTCEVDWMDRAFQVRVEPLRQGSHIVGAVGVALDVTEHRRVEEEFRIAQQIQQKLLPGSQPVLPGFDIGGCALFAEATGGDFFDYIPLPEGSLGIVIGDASGHGFGPALLAAVVHASLRTQALTGLPIDISTMLATSNLLLCEDSEDDQFVTLLFARLDPGKRSLTYSNAGHPPGYILDLVGTVKGHLPGTGMPLGTLPQESYPTPPPVALAAGDLVLFITDGIMEVMSPEDTQFGIERVLEVVRRLRHHSAQAIAEGLCGAALAFSLGGLQRDDATAVVIKVEPASEG